MTRPDEEMICPYPYVYPTCKDDPELIALNPDAAKYIVYADMFPVLYPLWRAIFLSIGLLLFAINTYRLRLAFATRSPIHKVVYVFNLLACITFVIRGVDPNGYRKIAPLLLVQGANYFTNGFLYSIFYSIGIIWGSVLQSYQEGWRVPVLLRLFGFILLVITWGIMALLDFSIATDPSGDHYLVVLLKYYSISVVGLAGCILLAYTGIALDKRIRQTRLLAGEITRPSGDVYNNRLSETPAAKEEGSVVGNTPQVLTPLSARDAQQMRAKALLASGGKKMNEQQEAPKPGLWRSLWESWTNMTKVMRITVIIVPLYLSVEASTLLRGITAHINGTDFIGWQTYNYCVYTNGPQYAAGKGGKCDPTFEYQLFASLQLIFAVMNSWIFSRIKGGSGSAQEEKEEREEKEAEERRKASDFSDLAAPLSGNRTLASSTSSQVSSFWSGSEDEDPGSFVMQSHLHPNFAANNSGRVSHTDRGDVAVRVSSLFNRDSIPSSQGRSTFSTFEDIHDEDNDGEAGDVGTHAAASGTPKNEKIYFEDESVRQSQMRRPSISAETNKKVGSYRKL